MHADVHRHVAGKPNPELLGGGRQRVERPAGDTRVNLEEVVAGGLLFRDQALGRRGVGHGVAVERGSRRVDGRPQQLALAHAVAQHKVGWVTEHASDGGDAARDVEQQDALVERFVAAREMPVHLREPWHQVLAGAIHGYRANRRIYGRRRPEFDDPIASHDHRMAAQDDVAVHGNHGDVDEDQRRRLHVGRDQRTQTERDDRNDTHWAILAGRRRDVKP